MNANEALSRRKQELSAIRTKQILWFVLLTCWALAAMEISLSTSSIRDDDDHGFVPRILSNRRSLGLTDRESRILTQEKVSLPIWGDPSGVDFGAIEAYMNYSLLPENRGAKHNILYPPHLYPHEYPVPNTVYVFGLRKESVPQVFVDQQTKKASPKFMLQSRLQPLEKLLEESLEHLINATTAKPTWRRLKKVITESTAGIPLIVNLDDHRHCSEGNLVYDGDLYNIPVWTIAAANPYQEYCHYSFPLPTYSTMELVKEIEQSTHDGPMNFAEQDDNHPWASKQSTLVWRGTSSGVAPLKYRTFKYNNNGTIFDMRTEEAYKEQRRRIQQATMAQIDPHNPETHPIRLQMVHRAMNYSVNGAASHNNNTQFPLLDIGYNPGIHQHYKDHFPHLQEKHYIKPMENFQNYKAVLDVDGNSWSERFARLLCMNSVVVKVKPEFVDYFFTSVEPWVHYVPVKQVSSDLWGIAQYIMEHDDEMQGIVRNARQWCKENMKYERLMEFMLDSLAFYVDMLDKHDKNWTERWKDLFERTTEDRTWRPLSKSRH